MRSESITDLNVIELNIDERMNVQTWQVNYLFR